jgi:hypothetical protein
MQHIRRQRRARRDFSQRFTGYTRGITILEYTHRWTRPRRGWKVLSGIGEVLSVPGGIAILFSAVGLVQSLVSWLLHWSLSPAELPICVLVIACALVVWKPTRQLKPLAAPVITRTRK